jgi:hypothetical protein
MNSMRSIISAMEAERNSSASSQIPEQREMSTNDLLKILVRSLTEKPKAEPDVEPWGPREWKPPSWDGRADTFKDYLLRLRSSYRVRSATKPALSAEYYWNAVYDTLPAKERARMRYFWETGSTTSGKDPEAFFTQLESVFADSNEQSKALETLTGLRHSIGQPWHEHQLEFDGLLLSAGGDDWAGPTKIGYLRNTFSNPAKMYTAAIPKTNDYYVFAEEVERIMTNTETTDQFKAANRRWTKEKGKDTTPSATVTTRLYRSSAPARVDADGDTIMTPTRTGGPQSKTSGDRKRAVGKKGSGTAGKQRAKWVDLAERERRREEKLCLRCGSGGHFIRECQFAPPNRQATVVTATVPLPVLESDSELSDPDFLEAGKE